VLRVISSSPGGLEPVFSAMLENALRICEAKFGILHRYSDGAFVAQAMVGAPLALVDALLHKPFTPPPGIPLDRMLRTKKLVHTLDAAAEENKPLSARLWAGATARGEPTISELCRPGSWPRASFDRAVERSAERVALYLNSRLADDTDQIG
jgi:hypothetical protein